MSFHFRYYRGQEVPESLSGRVLWFSNVNQSVDLLLHLSINTRGKGGLPVVFLLLRDVQRT